jgi:hypothetical protein
MHPAIDRSIMVWSRDLDPLNMWLEIRFLTHMRMEKSKLEGENPPYVPHKFSNED